MSVDGGTLVFDCLEGEIVAVRACHNNGEELTARELDELNTFKADWVYELYVNTLQ